MISDSWHWSRQRAESWNLSKLSLRLSAEVNHLKGAFVVSDRPIKTPAYAASSVSFTWPTFGNTWTTSEFKNKECEYKAHTPTHTHTHSIIIVMGFKQKHILVVCYYWPRAVGRAKRRPALTTCASQVMTASNNNHVHSGSICILSICMRTQIFDASGLGNTCVRAGLPWLDPVPQNWLPLSVARPLSFACVKVDLKYRLKTPIRCALTQVYVHSRALYNQQHDRSQLGPVKLF